MSLIDGWWMNECWIAERPTKINFIYFWMFGWPGGRSLTLRRKSTNSLAPWTRLAWSFPLACRADETAWWAACLLFHSPLPLFSSRKRGPLKEWKIDCATCLCFDFIQLIDWCCCLLFFRGALRPQPPLTHSKRQTTQSIFFHSIKESGRWPPAFNLFNSFSISLIINEMKRMKKISAWGRTARQSSSFQSIPSILKEWNWRNEGIEWARHELLNLIDSIHKPNQKFALFISSSNPLIPYCYNTFLLIQQRTNKSFLCWIHKKEI